jgi:hypothetical protein
MVVCPPARLKKGAPKNKCGNKMRLPGLSKRPNELAVAAQRFTHRRTKSTESTKSSLER